MYVERKPSLYIEELRSEFKDNLHHFKDGDEPSIDLLAL